MQLVITDEGSSLVDEEYLEWWVDLSEEEKLLYLTQIEEDARDDQGN